ncbi:PP2C family protein-serine/threonine phosphatase [Streptomyces sp. H27-C3]|uniref:PP2C family protein-serine/threonine phosphatase n=1 Tax=Streptomyces sp. H27-C3 TaxID=3046305 RepID=UPI0024B8CE79|nr:PP2C family protein-serine/threonine phosphatase [Streptomyces sp. H27-C3]MDJ0461410.1 PP2C family protein-serine/threonine phosphatase [Streptomyces sp. H27-C3]
MSSTRARGADEAPKWLTGAPQPRWFKLLPVAILVLLCLAQLATPESVQLGFFLVALPPVAALAYGPVSVTVLGVLTLLVLSLPYSRHVWYVEAGDLLAVLMVTLLSVVIAWVRTRRDEQLVTVRTVAEAAQLAVLPPLPAAVGRVRCAGLYRSAQRGALVGGDLYDVREGPQGVRAVVADVQGHGMAAVSTVAALLGAFREAVLDEADLAGIAARLDRRLVVDAGPEEHAELFATVLALEFPADEAVVRIICCGHPAPLLLRGGAARELPVDPSPPLGMGLAGAAPPKVVSVPLEPGDRILVHTDGVTEARDAAGTFYPLERRLAALAESVPADDLLGLTEAVRKDLVRFLGRADDVHDDVALLALAPGAHDRAQTAAARHR